MRIYTNVHSFHIMYKGERNATIMRRGLKQLIEIIDETYHLYFMILQSELSLFYLTRIH